MEGEDGEEKEARRRGLRGSGCWWREVGRAVKEEEKEEEERRQEWKNWVDKTVVLREERGIVEVV